MKNYKKTVVVFGCTGTVGRYVLEQLSTKNCQVRGILKNAQREYPIPLSKSDNLTYVSANLENVKEVEAACAFADVIFLLTATHPKQVQYETNVIKAAQKCGIQRIVKLSSPDIQPIDLVEVAKWHREIEEVLAQTNIECCNLRPYAFMQNWERNTFTIRRFGKFYGVMQDAPRNYVDARDVAEIATLFLLQDEPITQKNVTIVGPEAINYYEMAERLSVVTNRKIQYINVTSKELKHNLVRRAKLPLWLANHIIELDELAIKVAEPTVPNTEVYLKKQPRVMNAYLQEEKAIFSKSSIWSF